jgi:hypothetical protein
MVVDYWAIQVGETLWEVVLTPDDDEIGAKCVIRSSIGYQAPSGAVPDQVDEKTCKRMFAEVMFCLVFSLVEFFSSSWAS